MLISRPAPIIREQAARDSGWTDMLTNAVAIDAGDE
jgi:hypothetical protein